MCVAIACMMCTQSCNEGPGDMLPWLTKLNKKVCASSDYWTASASRCYFNKSKSTKQT